jgi:pimeloyl-ACP methyl ester carboxylesterase
MLRPIPEETIEFTGSGGVRLVATARGEKDAPIVLLLHGGGQTRQSWGGTAERLAKSGRRAITLDMRGHGESDWCPDGRYRVADFRGDLAAVLACLPRPAVLVGASLGGLTGLLYAESCDMSRVRGVVLVDIAARIESEGARRIGTWMVSTSEGFDSLDEVAAAIQAYTPNRKRSWTRESLLRVVRENPDGRYRWHWDPKFMSEGGPREVADHERLLRAAAALTVPTLLVRGRESDVISHDGVREFREAVPHAEFVDVSGAGHMVAGDRNDAFTDAVTDFLDRHDPA